MSETQAQDSHRFCIAPMLDWSDTHARYFWRLLSTHARLYTEMITTGALIHGERDRYLAFNPEEHPLALQLGGSVPEDLGRAVTIARDFGFIEINLNCNLWSEKVMAKAAAQAGFSHGELLETLLAETWRRNGLIS